MSSNRLTLKALVSQYAGGKIDQVKNLDLSKKGYKDIDDLGAFKALEKVNLSNNFLAKCKVTHYTKSCYIFLSVSL